MPRDDYGPGQGPASTPDEVSPVREEMQGVDEAGFFLASIVESSQDSIFTINSEGIITTWNKASQNLYGYSPPEAIGKPLTQLTLSPELLEVLRNTESGMHSRRIETGVTASVDNNRQHIDLEIVLSPIKDTAGKVIGTSIIARDITFRKQAEEAARVNEDRQMFLVRLGDALRSLSDPLEIQMNAARVEGEHLEADRAYYVEINEDKSEFVVACDWHRPGAPSHARRYPLEEWSMPWLNDGQTWVMKDVDTDPILPDEQRASYRNNNIRAAIVVPLIKEGRMVATFVVNQNTPRNWTAPEVALTEETAARTWDALERARAEEALREREERLRLVVESVTEYAIITHDIDGFITSWNSGAERAFGWTPDEAIGQHSRLIFTPEDIQLRAPEKEMETALRDGHARDERWHARKDGSRLFMSGVLSPLYDGGPYGFVKVARDLTREQQAEDALRASEARFRTLSDAVPQIIWTNEASGKANYFNSRWFEYSGLTFGESVGPGWQVIVHPDDAPASVERWNAALARGEVFDTEYRLRRFDGQYRWFIGRNVPLRDAGGHITDWFGSATDIQELKEAQQAVRESEERQRIAIDAGELATWNWDVVRDEIHWNERHFLLFGMTPRDGLMHSDDFTSHVHPDDRERVGQGLIQSLERAGIFESEFRIVREDNGQVRWMSGYGRTTEAQGGRTTRMSGVMYDSTERREAQEALRRSHEELEVRTEALAEALQQVQGLVKRVVNTQEEERARIARELHDNLGQHLTAVMLGLQTLEMQMAALTGGKRQQTAPQLDNLRTLVDGLMRAAHRQAWELRPAELDAMGLQAALGQYIRDWSERTQIEVDFHAIGWQRRPNSEVEITLYRVVQEALTNVTRHAQASFVSVSLQQIDGTASAIIEDNGVGFDTEQTTGRLGVLGMQERLALVGGTLDIESIPGDGTSVFARVPMNQERD